MVYDIILLGTSIKNCILSVMLLKEGKKVLLLDKNNYFGASDKPFSIDKIFEQHGQDFPSSKYNNTSDWSVGGTLYPILSHGNLTKLLIYTGVTTNVEFKEIDSSLTYKKGGNVYKIPANDKEALGTSLMGIFEKRRFKNFLIWATNLKFDDSTTHQELDPLSNTMADVYQKFGLDQDTADFIGHSIALHTNNNYLNIPFENTLRRIQLYYSSLSSYDKSPYLYPLQGEKGILAGFQQLMNDNDYPNELNKTIDEIIMEDGKVTGVKSGETVYQTNAVICSPDYAYTQAQQTGKHAKTICLYRHLLSKFDNVPSSQLCLPSVQLDSQYDAQLLSLSNDNKVCAKDWYISIINSTSDSNSVPDLTLASDLLAPLEDKFSSITDTYEPIHDGLSSKLFLTKSHNNSNYDMENEILNLFEKVVGSRFNMESVSDSIKS